MKKNNKGFTLAELLIVVAIIAVLVAIAIPIFTTQLEKARESTDAANIRSAYAEVMAAALEESKEDVTAEVEKVQTVDGWDNKGIEKIAGVAIDDIDDGGSGKVTVKYTAADGKVAIGNATTSPTFITSGGSSAGGGNAGGTADPDNP